MSVVDKDIIDGIALSKDKVIRLLLTDHLDWEEEYEHLLILQDKINSYLAFCESGQYKKVCKDCEAESVVFEIHFLYEPTQNVYKFLEQIPAQVGELSVAIECRVSEDSNNL